MKRIDMVYNKLKENESGANAAEIAKALNLARANVSSDLNKLCEEGMAWKDNGRPVVFHANREGALASVWEQGSSSFSGSVSPSGYAWASNSAGGTSGSASESSWNGDSASASKIASGMTTPSARQSHISAIDRFSKFNQSLFTAVEQAKAAILYPPKGMNILILGDTGVGKSMFASLIHKYAMEIKRLEKDAPFITFNCADYANNPQLLISQLFGTKKGAYTGADSDKPGLVEKAHKGILFLDEVHRLPPEGQELFFTFMDQGVYKRLGETEQERKAQVLIISATTENPDSVLLRTFTRRIPMVIRIPALAERSLEEKFVLISGFFKEESARLSKEIKVSVNTMRAFLSYNCVNNIGQLKTDIQLVCAKAYADYVSGSRNEIKIHSSDLPAYIQEGLYKKVEHRQIWNKLIGLNKRYCIYSSNQEDILFEGDAEEDSIYDMIDMRVHELQAKGLGGSELEKEMDKDIEDYFANYLYSVNRRVDTANLENIIAPEVAKLIEHIVTFSEDKLGRILSQRVYYGMAVHIANAIERIKRNKKIVNPQLNKIRVEHSEEFSVALECLKIIERAFDISMPIDEAGFIALFLVYDKRDNIELKEDVAVVVVAHGNSTATSMAEVANKLLGVNHVIGINAPLDEKPQEVLTKLKAVVKDNNITSDMLLLVDMGSLTNFGEELQKEFSINTRTIPLVSTLHIIEAARRAMLGSSLEEVYRDVLNVNSLIERESFLENTVSESQEQLAIITICTTGEGSARTIKDLLEKSLQYDDKLLEIIPMNITSKESITSKLKAVGKEKKVLCIVSSFNINTKIKQFGLYDVISHKATAEIQQLIDIETTYIKMGDTLKLSLKSINGIEALKDIKNFIKSIEESLNINIDTEVLIGITLHIGCMLERLKQGGDAVEFEGNKEYVKANPELYKTVRDACEALDDKYGTCILIDEICFIMRYFDINNY